MSATTTERMFRTVTPIDGSVVVERPLASDAEVDATLARAVEAQRLWHDVPAAERAAICTRAVEWCVARADELGAELTSQMGRPIAHSPFELRRGFQERGRYMSEIAASALADIEVERSQDFHRFIRREPLGAVLLLAPWNFPWLTSVNAVIPALLAGNAVILKMAQQTPLVAERYAEAFADAGMPAGVFQYLHVDHDQVARIIADERIAFVAFTGSVAGGQAVQRAAANRFIGTGLELGGKDAAYVRADVALDHAVENIVDGAFFNAGQSCCSVQRVYVDRGAYDRFVDAAVALTNTYVLGDPRDPATTIGPMVRADAAASVRGQVQDAIQSGAKPLVDQARFSAEKEGTAYMAPRILSNVSHDMRVMREETFGPVMAVMPVSGDDEAIRLINDSRYGLTSSVWTTDPEAALRIGNRIETGTWFMNRCDYLDPALAWTGVKDSGRGCTLSRLGIETFTRPKSFHLRLTT
ncbi:MAG TPA: aldehyde dehydrogenase family protein [Gemmatimonadaceae bacterium]|nr:aldehyde dehydrogenase family protein [Gemmatimonadaceae bacterium]